MQNNLSRQHGKNIHFENSTHFVYRLLALMYACPQQSQVNSGDRAVGICSASMPQATLHQNSPQSSLMTHDSMGTGQQKYLFEGIE